MELKKYQKELNKLNELRKLDTRTKTKNLETTANKIIQLHEKAYSLQEQINNISHELGQISNYKIQAVKYTNSVNYWLV